MCKGGGVLAADATYTYQTGAESIGDGKVMIAYDEEGRISSFNVTPSGGGKVTITGDALSFAPDATVTLAAAGTLSFENAVTTEGALSVVRGDGAYLSWSGKPLWEGYVTLFTDEQLKGTKCSDWEIVSAHFGNNPANGSAAEGLAYVGKVSNPCSLNLWDGRNTHGARFWMRDTSAGAIEGRVNVWSRSLDFENISDDHVYYYTKEYFDALPDRTPNVRATNFMGKDKNGKEVFAPGNVKMDQLTIRRKGASLATIRFDGGAELNGALTVGVGLKAVLVVFDDKENSLDHSIGGEGTFRIEAKKSAESKPLITGNVPYDGYLPRTWTKIIENRSLSSLTNIVGYMHGGSHQPGLAYNNPYNPQLSAVNFKNYGQYATCQFQYCSSDTGADGGHTIKCIRARVCQQGKDIVGMGIDSGSLKTAQGYNLGDDVDLIWNFPSYNVAVSTDTYIYGIEHMTFMFADSPEAVAKVALNAENTMTGEGRFEFSGGEDCHLAVFANHENPFPRGSTVRIEQGADVTLCANPSGDIWTKHSYGTWYPVLAGGTLKRDVSAVNGGFAGNQYVKVDGSILCIPITKRYGTPLGGDETNFWHVVTTYMNLIDFSGGSRLTGNPMNTIGGTSRKARWRVTGDAPCHFDSGVVPGFAPSAHNENDHYMIFEIEDVTRDEEVDATLSNVYNAKYQFGSGYQCAPIEKRGAGTLRIDGDYSPVIMWTRVLGGTFLLAKGSHTTAENPFRLNGGTLGVDAGAANEVGTLEIGAEGGRITLAAGASLSLADSSEKIWEGGLLIETADETPSIRFGSSDAALTAEQIRNIRLNEKRVRIDATGYIHQFSGFSVIIR